MFSASHSKYFSLCSLKEKKKQGFKQTKNGSKSQKEREKFYQEWLSKTLG